MVTVSDITERSDRPAGLGPGGAQLWDALLHRDPALTDVLNPNRVVAVQACRAKDRCDRASELVLVQPVIADNGKGQIVVNPVWTEARMHARSLAQLLAALRMPDWAGRRPQRRGGARGVYRRRR